MGWSEEEVKKNSFDYSPNVKKIESQQNYIPTPEMWTASSDEKRAATTKPIDVSARVRQLEADRDEWIAKLGGRSNEAEAIAEIMAAYDRFIASAKKGK